MRKSTIDILLLIPVFFILPLMHQALYATPLSEGDNPVVFNIQCVDGTPGEEVCIQFIVDNFEDIAGLQFAIVFDQNVLDYNAVGNEALSGSTAFLQGPNELRYIWTEAMANGITLPNGSLFFEICFDVIGLPGSQSPIQIVDLYGFPIEFSDSNSQPVDVVINDCIVNILNGGTLFATVTSCGPEGGIGNGSFTVTVSGGTGPYTVDWQHTTIPGVNGSEMIAGPGSSATVNTVAGTYDITVTDNTGSTFLLSVVVENVGFITSVAGFNPFCTDFTNGRIVLDAVEGDAPYGFVWEHATNPQYFGAGFIFTQGGSNVIPSLPVGTYYLTITDDRGCQHLDTVVLDVPPFTIQEMITDATCDGSMDGRVDFIFGGATPDGMGNYNIQWQNSNITASSLSAVQLNPGEYSVTVTDSRGCDTIHTFTIGSLTEITANILTTDASCVGVDDGEAEITALTNGATVGPYDINVFEENGNLVTGGNNIASTLTVTGLGPGNYYVLIDEGICSSDSLFFTISESAPISITLVELRPNSCLSVNDGSIEIMASGGTLAPGNDYDYTWTGGLIGAEITGLGTGNYSVTVTDDNGCTATMSYTVPQAVRPMVDSIVVEDISCIGLPTASLTVYFSQGTNPVTNIDWNTGDSGPTISNLVPGTYTVTIRDDFFCFDIESFTVPGAGAMTIDSLIVEEPTCAGLSDGQITVFASGADEPYSYAWSTGDTTDFNLYPGLSSGTYTVTVIDAEDCSTIDTTITLNDPEGLTLAFSGIDTVSCQESCDGIATITPSGGDPGLDYNFVWESGFMETGQTSTAIDLCTGMQSVTVTQDGNCFFVDSVFIPAPDSIVSDPDITDASCYGSTDGEVELNVSGGNPGYTVQWLTLPDGETQSGLGAGTYYFTVMDATNCTYSDSITIAQPDSLAAALDSVLFMPLSCGGTDDGIIAVIAEGGTPDYTYTWTPNVSQSAMGAGLGPGDYTIVVTDANNCTDQVDVTLVSPDPIEAFYPEINPPACAGELTFITVDSASGGNGPYHFTINGAGNFAIGEQVPVPAGLYVISVQDDSGCFSDSTFMIEDPDPIGVSIFPEDPIVRLGDQLQLQLLFDSLAFPITSILWSPDATLSCNTCPDPMTSTVLPVTYTVTVTNAAGCTETISVFVDVDSRRLVYIPNVFSPNRDGVNDKFQLFTGEGVESIETFRIFDRWGQLMYEDTDIIPNGVGIEGWDGTKGSKEAMPGVYVYVAEVRFIDGEIVVFRGDVTLVR